MGVGRFVYTPVLPLMHSQAGLSAAGGADLATANYAGYFAGALAGILAPALVGSRAVLRGSLAALVVSLAAMPAVHGVAAWGGLRLVAGAASALVFVIAASSLLGAADGRSARLSGWAFGGVGAGIAASGLLVLAVRPTGDWRLAWWASAALAAVLAAAAWNLRTAAAAPPGAAAVRPGGGFAALFAAYTLEGLGYIVAGTFLVAAIDQGSPGPAGSGAWVLVGLAAAPSAALWARLAGRRPRAALLRTAYAVQAVGIALPALVGGVPAALVSALLFGATFMGISTLALATGTRLGAPRAVPLLTVGHSAGQILGPLVVAPLLHHGYQQALLLAAGVVAAGALAVLALPAEG
ncbi:YbfB/YjiJ family MFS transporter [Kitasatospora sp. NPDC094011]|uniref:YbfB/YjiJ family MFS transporter n=1 Tax=Kitasatospora sp. NPDC094011 TaxID=3364090 RepID=UPI0037FCDB2B